jgi:hypothetical protein
MQEKDVIRRRYEKNTTIIRKAPTEQNPRGMMATLNSDVAEVEPWPWPYPVSYRPYFFDVIAGL